MSLLIQHRYEILAVWLVVINLLAIVATIRDKHSAQQGRWRIRERTLLLLGAFGGSLATLLTMRQIHHKTRHPKFMIGLPVLLAIQIVLLVLAVWKWGF